MASAIMSKNMEKALYEMINCLAEKHGFDPDEAFEYVRWETEIDHVGVIFKMVGAVEEEKAVAKAASVAPTEETASVATSGGDDVPKKIAECKKNIALWEKKLGDGKVKDADKQREKITKEKAKLAKLEAKVGTVVPAEKVEETKPELKKEEPKVEAPKEKRIKRFSPVMSTQLTTALNGVGVGITDKLKKEFQQFIEDLGEDTYREKGLADHMRDFAKTKAPVTEIAKKTDEVEVLVKEMDALIVEEKGSSNAAGPGGPVVHKVSLEELQKINYTVTTEPTGALWDADNGRFVDGPESVADEDFEEYKYAGKSYAVGVDSGRVYEVQEKGDIFAGWIGVGRFKLMTRT